MKETMAMRAPLLERLEELLDRGGTKKDVALLAVSAVALGFSFFAPETLPFNPAWIAIVLCGAPIILGAVIGLVTEFDIKADVLVSLALIAAVAIGEDFAAGEVALIMQLGALLEDLTVAKARAGIERLVHLSPRTARIVRDGVETVVAAEDVQVGDVLRVLPGETVAVEVETRFKVKEVDNGESKQGEDTSSKLSLVCTYYRLTMNGKELVEIDVLNMIEKVNGVDRLDQHRRNIGL